MKSYVAVVRMVKSFVAVFSKEPSKDLILEVLKDAIEYGEIDDSFETEVKEIELPVEE